MPDCSDRDGAILRTIAKRIDASADAHAEASPSSGTSAPPLDAAALEENRADHPAEGWPGDQHESNALVPQPGQKLLERDRLRRHLLRAAALALVVLLGGAGAYAFLASPIGWRHDMDLLIKRVRGVPATGGFSVVRAVIAERVGQDGHPHNVASSFVGRTPVAVLFDTRGGKPGTDVLRTTIAGAGDERPCEPMVVNQPGATYWCQWEGIDPGQYTITIRLNDVIVHQLSLAVVDRPDAKPGRSPGRDIKSDFECLRPEGAIERAICENDALSRLEAHMDALYRSVAEGTDQAGRVRLRQQQNAFVSARRIKCGEATADDLASCLVFTTQARLLELEAIRLPSFLQSMSFADARRQLMGLGWRPVTISSSAPCRPGEVNCRGGLEMVVCSAGPPATCRHTWMRQGTIIEITATSGEKSQVRSVVCRAGCQ